MHCDHVQQQLNALVDGELNRWQQGCIQKHLRRCASCTAELAAIQQIGDQAKAWRHVGAPATLKARIVQTLAKSQVNDSSLSLPNEETSTMNTHNTVLSSPQNIGRNNAARFSMKLNWRPVAALSGLGVALALMALFLMPTRKSFAFAAVIQAMQKVRTVHWTVKANGFQSAGVGANGNDELTVMEAWASLDRPAYTLLVGPGGEVKMLLTPDKHTMIADGKVLMELPMPPIEMMGKDKVSGLRAFILAQLVAPAPNAQSGSAKGDKNLLSTLENQNGFKQEEVIFDGKRVVLFSSDTKLGEGRFTLSLWIDPATHLVVRSETRMPSPIKGQPDLVSIATQFRYNEEPPVGVFDLPTK